MRASEFIKEARLGNVLPWPEIVNKVNGAMKAMGWKGQRKDDGSFMFSTKGQLDDEFYIVIIDNEGNSMFTYALGTVEEGDPHIGEKDTLPTTEASISELMDAIREGFGLSEQMIEDWNKVNKKDKTDGLSKKAVKAYRRENPGSKLQTAVTTKPSKLKAGSKDAKRRKSFCARMSGNKGPMKDEKGKPTRKALALKAWNC
jgi:hypothetical protein